MNLSKIIGVPLIVIGGLGTLYSGAGLFATALHCHFQDQKIDRMYEYRNYVINKKNSDEYASISNGIQSLKENREKVLGYSRLGLAGIFVFGGIALTGFTLVDKGGVPR